MKAKPMWQYCAEQGYIGSAIYMFRKTRKGISYAAAYTIVTLHRSFHKSA